MAANDNAIVHIKWCNFKSDFTDQFKSLLQTGELSDIRIKIVDGKKIVSKIFAHKFILRNESEYFRDLFNLKPWLKYIKLPIDAVAAKFAIFFMYHGEVNIPKTVVGKFLEATKLLRLKGFETVGKSDLRTERDCKIKLGKRVDEYSEYIKSHDSHQTDFIAPTGKPLRKKVRRFKALNIDLECHSNSISRASTKNSCLKWVDASHMSSADNSSSSSSIIDFCKYKKASSDGQSSPEIVD